MQKVSISLTTDHVRELDALQHLGITDSRSESVRHIIDDWDDLRTECDDLRTECERLRERLDAREDRIDDLEEQLARRSQIEDKVDTLAKRVEQKDDPDPPWPVRWYRWLRE